MPTPFQFQRKTPSSYAWLSTPPQPDVPPPPSNLPSLDPNLPIPNVDSGNTNQVSMEGRAPLIVSDNGFPKIMPKLGLDSEGQLEAQKQRRVALQDYEPQKSHGLKRLGPVVPAVTAGAGAGGGWGALGGLGVGLLMSKLDPAFSDRMKKQRELAKINQTIGTLENERSGDVQDKLRQAQLGNINAETGALLHPTPKPRPSAFRVLTKDEGPLKKGTKIATEFNTQTGQWEDTGRVLDLAEKKAAPDRVGGQTRILAEGEYGLPAGTKIHLMPNGEDAVVNSKPLVAEPAPSRTTDVSFGNQQIKTSIAEAQTEKAKIKDALASTAEYLPDTQDANGAVVKHPNPIYKDLKDQDRALDKQIREWRMKLKPEPKSATPKLTIEGAIERFTKVKGRAPNQTEIANMQAALPQ